MKNIYSFYLCGLFILTVLASCNKTELNSQSELQLKEKSDLCISYDPEFYEDIIDELCYDPRNANPFAFCPANIDPVCACGVITFGNACTAGAYGFQNVTKGSCVEQKCYSPVVHRVLSQTLICPDEEKPVCGCNGKTYKNKCEARRGGALMYRPGKCEEDITINVDEIIEKGCFDPRDVLSETECPMVLAPVCACGVIEFSNGCMARMAGFQNYEQGGCVKNRCTSNTLKEVYDKYPINCNNYIGPKVCGCDGNTYQNACYAISNGVTAYYPGPCGSIHEDL